MPPESLQTPNRPPTPQPPPKIPQEKYTLDDMASSLEKLSLKGSEPRHTHMRMTHSHSRRRQRKDRDTSQLLLTPPLTPSSSIRTAASTGSADGKPDDKVQTLQELQEPEATRFLYVISLNIPPLTEPTLTWSLPQLENVSRTIALNTLQSVITGVLEHLPHRRGPSVVSPTDQPQVTAGESSCIKGFFMRNTKATGSLFLAFHDVRDAIAAQIVLSQRTDGVLAECLGEEKLIDGVHAWFRCRFIAAEELVKVTTLFLYVNLILLKPFIYVIDYW